MDVSSKIDFVHRFRSLIQQLALPVNGTGKDGFDKDYDILTSLDYDQRKDLENFHTAAQGCNRCKNRYEDVLPNESTMCKVSGVPESDSYYNGNFVCPPGSYHSYICCQAPLKCTTGDFWNVAWYYGARVIVMLCNEFENGRHKSERYWPGKIGDKQRYSHFDVLFKTEEVRMDHIVRSYMVTNTLNGEFRDMVQYQYTGWPDFGVPDNCENLVELMYTVDKDNALDSVDGETRPIVCHCSAGIGRTGTFLAIHAALAHFQNGKEFDIFSIVKNLKQQRCGMIQRKEQYRFCFDTALTELERLVSKMWVIAPPRPLSPALNQQTRFVGPEPPPPQAQPQPTGSRSLVPVYQGQNHVTQYQHPQQFNGGPQIQPQPLLPLQQQPPPQSPQQTQAQPLAPNYQPPPPQAQPYAQNGYAPPPQQPPQQPLQQPPPQSPQQIQAQPLAPNYQPPQQQAQPYAQNGYAPPPQQPPQQPQMNQTPYYQGGSVPQQTYPPQMPPQQQQPQQPQQGQQFVPGYYNGTAPNNNGYPQQQQQQQQQHQHQQQQQQQQPPQHGPRGYSQPMYHQPQGQVMAPRTRAATPMDNDDWGHQGGGGISARQGRAPLANLNSYDQAQHARQRSSSISHSSGPDRRNTPPTPSSAGPKFGGYTRARSPMRHANRRQSAYGRV